ncbi:MAG: deoxyribodipyrimidine photolyase [Syntrophus sp. (in: bacteria)]|nr:deoxyribodipyrimidine photolyase [Syntrophus sp. (in: bacteria)]
MNRDRLRVLKEGQGRQGGPVVYWMSRDQRVDDNWALLYAQEAALERKAPLIVVFTLAKEFLNATIRQYRFMLKGLEKVSNELADLNIPFYLLMGSPDQEITRFIDKHSSALLVTDFDPMRIKRAWKKTVCDSISIPFHEVDAHNIVPCWKASPKQEYGAFTFRPKIRRLLEDYLETFPNVEKHPFLWGKEGDNGINRGEIEGSLKVNTKISEVGWVLPGADEAQAALRNFLKDRISVYSMDRNDPNKKGQSRLSPYLHFGQISAQRVVLEVEKGAVPGDAHEIFLEELIVRRELSDNFCFYNDRYDSFEGFPEWAKRTLNEHRGNHRGYVYSLTQFEGAETHDELWNASQMEMVKGKMHGYMRMYWAKKILEWTGSPEEAIEIAIYLNDKYELDGRDPNGYTGIAWSIGGVHDRPWGTRNIFGSIRYMSYKGCKSKFNIPSYVHYVTAL